jgi:hypothetical protein
MNKNMNMNKTTYMNGNKKGINGMRINECK